MLAVTPSACEFLRGMLEHSHAPDGTAVRIVAKDEGLRTTIDTLHEGDSIVEDHGRLLLVLDPTLSERLAERTLDVEPEARTLLLT